jgi:hypothetical protein
VNSKFFKISIGVVTTTVAIILGCTAEAKADYYEYSPNPSVQQTQPVVIILRTGEYSPPKQVVNTVYDQRYRQPVSQNCRRRENYRSNRHHHNGRSNFQPTVNYSY